ncbi:hypothetical protein GLW05_19700 [Pontibacillus yanchengensis]|uniref:SEC-C domain-containing protein n=1 Tax=Pontibacillus yanchengensis TaxID=462910 RepID=A0A6I5A696_9BACI|nr:SEC-C metal-binding domain-containing protein [Pontibacillus yanchengensis]MYL35799.1 hypothetical protein [Pontibacillus yanchengensis]
MNSNQILRNIQKGRERDAERLRKREEEFWHRADDAPRLKDVLQGFRKHELDDIRKTFGFQGLSSLNKGELVEELTTLIPQHYSRTLHLLDQQRYQFMKKMVKNQGQMSAKGFLYPNAYAFMSYCLAFPATFNGERSMVLPKELQEAFREADDAQLNQIVRENTEWIQLAEGMLYYYGYMSSHRLVKAVEYYTDTKLNEKVRRFFQVLSAYKIWELDPQIVSVDAEFAYVEVLDINELKEQQVARSEIPYYPFTKDELIEVGANIHKVRPSDSMKPFLQLMRNAYDIEEYELQSFAEIYETYIKQGMDINKVIEEVQESFDIPDYEFFKQLADAFVYANNNTRLWMLKGHKPTEISRGRESDNVEQNDEKVLPFKNTKKVGRNELCPCGSGKKYKKCCGK